MEQDRMHRSYQRSAKSPSVDPANSSQSSNYVLNKSKTSEPEREEDWNVTQEEMSDPETPTEEDESFNKSKSKKGSTRFISFTILLTVITFMIPNINYFSNSILNFFEISKTIRIKKCEFDKLDQEYKGQDKYMWKTLESGLEKILNEESAMPAVYLFIYKKNPTGEPAMIKKIVNRASECFDPSLKPIYMSLVDFSSEASILDYGVPIAKYKSIIKEGNVLLIAKLNDIPPPAARALHFICDVHSPITKRVVIFLTLEVPYGLQGIPSEIAGNALSKMWKEEMGDADLLPLITRVTEEVIVVREQPLPSHSN